jgi:hypothetical protein
MKQRQTHNATTQLRTTLHTKGCIISVTRDERVKHGQKDTTNGSKRVRVENYKDMAFNSVVRVMAKSDRANKQREERRAKRKK